MSATRKKLGAPKGADATTQAALNVLGARFHDESSPEPDVRGAYEVPHTSGSVPHTRVETPLRPTGRRNRTEPEGMSRKTYYVTTDAADALAAAVAEIHVATGNRMATHEALSALLHAAAEQAPAVANQLRRQMLGDIS